MSESKTQDNKLSLNKPGRLELKKTVETGQVFGIHRLELFRQYA